MGDGGELGSGWTAGRKLAAGSTWWSSTRTPASDGRGAERRRVDDAAGWERERAPRTRRPGAVAPCLDRLWQSCTSPDSETRGVAGRSVRTRCNCLNCDVETG
jgi:hypothetical protein